MSLTEPLFAQLEQADRELLAAGLGDFPALEATLAKRSVLIREAAGTIETLRQPTAEHRDALVRSREAGFQAMRQLILAKHLLATELALVRREQRLWADLSAQTQPAARPGYEG